ncbi:hypothetical protein [Pedobacter sp.]|uniref:hypothetical protein n=1 Tax=Pedobacter sp. TaxID=1411316 RepID=UPI003BAC127F
MEQLDAPNSISKRFILDRKANYFFKKGQKDSSLIYSKKRLSMDAKDELQNGKMASSVITGNLYLSYTNMAGVYLDLNKLDSVQKYLKQAADF